MVLIHLRKVKFRENVILKLLKNKQREVFKVEYQKNPSEQIAPCRCSPMFQEREKFRKSLGIEISHFRIAKVFTVFGLHSVNVNVMYLV